MASSLIRVEKLEKLKKIGIVLLILSLLVSLITFNPLYFIINLLLICSISIIRFGVVRFIAIIISIYSIYFLILNLHSNVLSMTVAMIQVLLCGGGLYFILYSYYIDRGNEIIRKDLLFFLKAISILIIAAILIYFVKGLNSTVYVSIR